MQASLFDVAPPSLDSTCSSQRIWPEFANIRMDIRRSVKPDIVASACYLPFRDSVFGIIYCDPPHFIGPNWNKEKEQEYSRWFLSVNRKRLVHEFYRANYERYGFWKSRDEWLTFVRETNKEFARCLKKGGTLEYKICETKGTKSIKFADLDLMTNFVRVGEKGSSSQANKNPTLFLTFKRRGGV